MECARGQAEVCEAHCNVDRRIQRQGGGLDWTYDLGHFTLYPLQGMLADVELYSTNGKCSNVNISPLPSPRLVWLQFWITNSPTGPHINCKIISVNWSKKLIILDILDNNTLRNTAPLSSSVIIVVFNCIIVKAVVIREIYGIYFSQTA